MGMHYFSSMVCISARETERGVAFVMTTKPEIAPGWHRFGLEASPLLPARSTITTSLMSPVAPAVCSLADTQSLRLSNEKRLSGEGAASCTIQKMPGSQETRTPQMGLPPNGSSRR